MELARHYEYVYGLIKARMGNRLKQDEYEAILGCKEPKDLFHVLSKTVYKDSLPSSKTITFEDMIEAITVSVSNYTENLINSIPKSDVQILIEYKKLLESRSLVNFLKSKIRTDNVVAMMGVMPLGSFPALYYNLEVLSKEKSSFPELLMIIQNSISLVKKYNTMAPLLKIVSHFCEVLSDKIPISNFSKWASLRKLVNHMNEATTMELIILSSQSGLTPQIKEKWISSKDDATDNRFNALLAENNIERVISKLKKTRYGSCLEQKSNENINDLVERFPYCVMSREAHSVLAGYPFLPSTAAAGMMLIIVEVRNIKLAIAAVAGRLDKLEALRLMTIS